jgi:hypothetical protein
MGAQLRHASKYTSAYSNLYPNARILLITTSWADFLYRANSMQQHRLAAAVATLCADSDERFLVRVQTAQQSQRRFSKRDRQNTAYQGSRLGQCARSCNILAISLDDAPHTAEAMVFPTTIVRTLCHNCRDIMTCQQAYRGWRRG